MSHYQNKANSERIGWMFAVGIITMVFMSVLLTSCQTTQAKPTVQELVDIAAKYKYEEQMRSGREEKQPEVKSEAKEEGKKEVKEEVKPEPIPDYLDGVKIIYHDGDRNIKSWPIGIKTNIHKSGNLLVINSDVSSKDWQGFGNKNSKCCLWVIFTYQGQKYSGCVDYLQETTWKKTTDCINGRHIERDPVKAWEPVPGEELEFFITGMARGQGWSNKQIRSNVVRVKL